MTCFMGQILNPRMTRFIGRMEYKVPFAILEPRDYYRYSL